MSISFKKLDVVRVLDPRVSVMNKVDYVYLEGASDISQKNYVTTSVAVSSLQFSCPPPSASTFVDRKIYFHGPVRLTFTATSTATGQTILNARRDAPRQYGLSAGVDTIKGVINNCSISNNISDYLHPLLKFNNGDGLKYGQYSVTPSYPDQSQLYSSMSTAVRNPLGNYGDSIDKQSARGGFNRYKVVSQTVSTGASQALTSIVDIVFIEPFFILAPFYWGEGETNPFVGVTTMDFTINMLNQAANRMWSRDETQLALTSLNYTWGSLIPSGGPAFSFSDTQPSLQFTYFTPKETQMIPRDLVACYPYFDIQRYPTDISVSGTNQGTFTTNNVQLSSIPNRIYIFVRQQNNTLFNSCTNTDTFAAIDKLSIQYFNRTGILSSCTRNQLYQMSVKNGCNMSWEQWSGDPVYIDGAFSSQYNTVGSVICLNPATDLGLTSLQAPGKIDHNTLQIDVTLRSLNSAITNYTMFIVVVNEGVFTIGPGSTMYQVGVLTSEDILDAKSKPFINYELIKDINGGNCASGLGNFWDEKIVPFLKESKILSNAAKLIPFAGPVISESIHNVGYGQGVLVNDPSGQGVFVGGQHMSRGNLKDSMRKRIQM